MLENAGIIIECGSCGFLRHISLIGTPETIESSINDTIQEGWRFTKKWQGYICPKCVKNGTDPLYELYVGKPRLSSKKDSYKALLIDACKQLQLFRDMG